MVNSQLNASFRFLLLLHELARRLFLSVIVISRLFLLSNFIAHGREDLVLLRGGLAYSGKQSLLAELIGSALRDDGALLKLHNIGAARDYEVNVVRDEDNGAVLHEWPGETFSDELFGCV